MCYYYDDREDAMRIDRVTRATLAAIVWIAALVVVAKADTLKLGLIAPLTGSGAGYGLAAQTGLEVAAAEANAKGGLDVGGKDYEVEIVPYDDQFKAAEALSAYNRLVNKDGARFVFVLSSVSTLAIKNNAEADGVIALTSGSTVKAFDENTKYLFRLYSPPTEFLAPMVGWLRNNLKQRRIAILNSNDETGWVQNDQSKAAFKADGFDVIDTELYEQSLKDFQPMLTKVIALGPEIIDLGAATPASAGLLVRQARELGYQGLFVKTSGSSPKEIVAAAGKEFSEGIVNMLFADSSNPGFQRLAEVYQKEHGQNPNEVIVSYYDAANILMRAIQAAGSATDTEKVSDSFSKALPMVSVMGDQLTLGGKHRIGIDHQIMTVNYIGIIRDGQPVVVGKIAAAN
jgi:branched-chain amino acid transport system substrate-binding protein